MEFCFLMKSTTATAPDKAIIEPNIIKAPI